MDLQHFYKITFLLLLLSANISGFFQTLKKYTYCQITECCNDDYITPTLHTLKTTLDEKLYGQHLVKQVVVDALISHFTDENPQKALTLSFHGWPGSGKNYVTRFIMESLYKKGSQSKFVHHFNAGIHFPLKQHADIYKSELQNWIRGNVSLCEKSLFVFDEVDKMPSGVLNAIKPMIDYIDFVEKVDYRKSVFIFLSNTGGTIIKDHLLSLWELGVKREQLQLSNFEHLISKGAFNEKGGFHYSDTIKNSFIDHYIPFLPLEKQHVELCVRYQFQLRGVKYPTEEQIEEVTNMVEWGPHPINLFSTTGCKRISQKVPLVIRKYRLKTTKTEL